MKFNITVKKKKKKEGGSMSASEMNESWSSRITVRNGSSKIHKRSSRKKKEGILSRVVVIVLNKAAR